MTHWRLEAIPPCAHLCVARPTKRSPFFSCSALNESGFAETDVEFAEIPRNKQIGDGRSWAETACPLVQLYPEYEPLAAPVLSSTKEINREPFLKNRKPPRK